MYYYDVPDANVVDPNSIPVSTSEPKLFEGTTGIYPELEPWGYELHFVPGYS